MLTNSTATMGKNLRIIFLYGTCIHSSPNINVAEPTKLASMPARENVNVVPVSRTQQLKSHRNFPLLSSFEKYLYSENIVAAPKTADRTFAWGNVPYPLINMRPSAKIFATPSTWGAIIDSPTWEIPKLV